MIGHATGPRERLFDTPSRLGQRGMGSATIVVQLVQGDGVPVVLDLLEMSIGQASQTTHVHRHREILAFNETGDDMRFVEPAHHPPLFKVDQDGRAVPRRAFRSWTVELDQRRVIHAIPAESLFDC